MPAIPEERIRTLIQKYLTDSLTTAEEQEFGNLAIKYPRTMELLDQMESEGVASPAFQQRQQEALERGLAKAHALIYPSENLPAANPPGKIPVIGKRRTRWIYYGAAAILLGVIFFIPSLRNSNPGKAPSTPVVASTATGNIVGSNIGPGGDKATLTLADGESIRLDSWQPGRKLPDQEGVSAALRDSGTIVYTAGTGTRILYNTITTPRGGQCRVILPDGTKVWLNDSSSLRYPIVFSGETREVGLTGEAFFDVAKDAAKPFTIKVNDLAIHVLGTQFCVSAYTKEKVRTALVEGAVKVKGLDPRAPRQERAQILKPGQTLESNTEHDWKFLPEADADEAIGWTRGNFVFRNTPLSEILKNIARWYDIDLDLRGMTRDPVYELSLSRNRPLSEVLKILAKGANFRMVGRKLIAKTTI